ncbi:MAG: mechanosensitive ion channel family protein, partial [Bacteroidales bacterium]|nr:mechanosensitive ion channel family protein [Bacteroidales bacterium]
SVHIGTMRDSSVQLVLWAWVKVEDFYPVQFEVSKQIYKQLPENGVQFPFPQLDGHLDHISGFFPGTEAAGPKGRLLFWQEAKRPPLSCGGLSSKYALRQGNGFSYSAGLT